MKLPSYVNSKNLETRLGENGMSIMRKKYLQKDKDENLIETPIERFYTIASKVAGVEKKYGKSKKEISQLTREFYEIISHLDFLPGGRVISNVGTELKALANCYVLPIKDDLIEIYKRVTDAAIIHKNGGGTGYNFSQLRPRGYKVKNGVASGPVSFAGQFDKETEVINSGNRRGANMGILNIDHPGIFDFIRAKFEEEKLTNFNVSIGITDEFMEAYKKREFYSLKFNEKEITKKDIERMQNNIEKGKAGAEVGKNAIPSSLMVEGNKVYNVYPELDESNRIFYEGKKIKVRKELIGKIDKNKIVKINAKKTLETIAKYAHANGDPGVIFLDRLEEGNLLKVAGKLDSTNPCGEQPLHPFDACNLGSLNLANMIIDNNGIIEVNYEKIEKITKKVVRFMDNINDLNKGPIQKIEETILNHRRIGLGIMGFADMLVKLKIPYDSKEGLNLAEEIMDKINNFAKEESYTLAKEKGAFPFFEKSNYPKNKPIRNLARTTIAPTGSIAMLAGINGGIEPLFALIYTKKMRGGDSADTLNQDFLESIKKEGLNQEEILKKVKENNGSCQNIKEVPQHIKKIFRTAHDINYKSHVEMQSAFQRHTDNAISKTINFSENATIKDILNSYVLGYNSGIKGMTVYVDGSRENQVLETGSRKKNLEEVALPAPREIPAIMPSIKLRQSTSEGNIHMELVVDPKKNYKPIEVFVQLGNAGSEENAIMEALGRTTSLHLRRNLPLNELIAQYKDIGSGAGVVTRDGGVHSLPMGFARGLMKFEIMNKDYGIENILVGKVNYDQMDKEISDKLRKSSGEEWEKNRLPEEKKDENNVKTKLVRKKCPECKKGYIIHRSGCEECSAQCGHSKC
jgi:ribonucleoside-diphosphate reductase alpha chain|tara:strand:+ start:176 stop:2752 length:2577 start_codon:yes stop_codon:yes gene_type:complete